MDFRPIDEDCSCSTCKNYTRAYLHTIGIFLFHDLDVLWSPGGFPFEITTYKFRGHNSFNVGFIKILW